MGHIENRLKPKSNQAHKTFSSLCHVCLCFFLCLLMLTQYCTLQPLQQSPLLHIASCVSVHFLQQAPPLRAHSCRHRRENESRPPHTVSAEVQTFGERAGFLTQSHWLLTTWDPQSHSSPGSTKPFPHSGGSNSWRRQAVYSNEHQTKVNTRTLKQKLFKFFQHLVHFTFSYLSYSNLRWYMLYF